MKTSLFLMRHAEVEEKYHRVFGGSRIDMGLSALGHRQADALAGWLRRHTFDGVYASPMLRVQLTMDPFRPQYPGTPVLIDGLREVDFGSWTGFGWNDVQEKFGASAHDWLDLMERDQIPGAEPMEAFRSRVADAIRFIVDQHPGQKVAVFAHGGVVRMALSHLLGLPMRKFEHFDVDYAGATWVDIGEVKAGRARTEVQLMNFVPWRDL